MKYIIMCGGPTLLRDTPQPLFKVNDETLVERTIRLLRENGIDDIAISSPSPEFDNFGVPRINWGWTGIESDHHYSWLDCFYPNYSATCYLYGDVFYSPDAIKTIVNTGTSDTIFFASAPPFHKRYMKAYAEPFAFKVADTSRFRRCIKKTRSLEKQGYFTRGMAISWELWQVIRDTPINKILYNNYVAINDYTIDIDNEEQLEAFKKMLRRYRVKI